MIVLPPALPAHRIGDANVFVELVQQVLEPVGDALAQHLVVDALKDAPQPSSLARRYACSPLTSGAWVASRPAVQPFPPPWPPEPACVRSFSCSRAKSPRPGPSVLY